MEEHNMTVHNVNIDNMADMMMWHAINHINQWLLVSISQGEAKGRQRVQLNLFRRKIIYNAYNKKIKKN